MRFKLFCTEIVVTYPFSAVLVFLLLTDRTGLALPLLTAVLLHEMGHFFAMWLLECPPKRVRLTPAAIEITSPPATDMREEIVIALAGPGVNLVLFLSLYLNFLWFRNETVLLYATVNLIIGLFNLLPVAGLDGGTVLYSAVTAHFGAEKARLILRVTGLLLAGTGLAAGVFFLLQGAFRPTFWIMGLYLLVLSLMKM